MKLDEQIQNLEAEIKKMEGRLTIVPSADRRSHCQELIKLELLRGDLDAAILKKEGDLFKSDISHLETQRDAALAEARKLNLAVQNRNAKAQSFFSEFKSRMRKRELTIQNLERELDNS